MGSHVSHIHDQKRQSIALQNNGHCLQETKNIQKGVRRIKPGLRAVFTMNSEEKIQSNTIRRSETNLIRLNPACTEHNARNRKNFDISYPIIRPWSNLDGNNMNSTLKMNEQEKEQDIRYLNQNNTNTFSGGICVKESYRNGTPDKFDRETGDDLVNKKTTLTEQPAAYLNNIPDSNVSSSKQFDGDVVVEELHSSEWKIPFHKCSVRISPEKAKTINSFVQTMLNAKYTIQKEVERKNAEYQALIEKVRILEDKLHYSLTDEHELESFNKKIIMEAVEHKYIHAEIAELRAQLDRRKAILRKNSIEEQNLHREIEHLKQAKWKIERRYQEALLASNMTTNKLRTAFEHLKLLEPLENGDFQLKEMLNKLQFVIGKIRVLVALKTTAHDSCVQVISSSALTFDFHGNVHHDPEDKAVFRFSHIVPPGTCNSLEVYNEVSMTIDGVVDGLHASFVTVGPQGSGKTSTLFGAIMATAKSQEHRIRTQLEQERESFFLNLCNSTPSNPKELTRSVKFAHYYGVLGLSLLHLLQYTNVRSIISDNSEDSLKMKEYKISVSIFCVPLDESIPLIDLLAKRLKFERFSASEMSGNFGCMVFKNVKCLYDVVRVCEEATRRFRRRWWSKHQKRKTNIVAIVRVQRSNYQNKARKRKNNDGFLFMINTAGYEESEFTCDSKSFPDVSSPFDETVNILQTLCTNTNDGSEKRSRLQRIIYSCLKSKKPPMGLSKNPATMILLHLPCARDQAICTMHSLRLGLWLVKLNQVNARADRKMFHTKESKPKARKCGWQIGHIGYASAPHTSNQPSIDEHTAAKVHRSDIIPHHRTSLNAGDISVRRMNSIC